MGKSEISARTNWQPASAPQPGFEPDGRPILKHWDNSGKWCPVLMRPKPEKA